MMTVRSIPLTALTTVAASVALITTAAPGVAPADSPWDRVGHVMADDSPWDAPAPPPPTNGSDDSPWD
jgi:hypothetical protein